MWTSLLTGLVLMLMAPPGGHALTYEEMAKFQVRPGHVEQNTGVTGMVVLINEGDFLRLRSNGVPDHHTACFPDENNPFGMEEQEHEELIPSNPVMAEQPSCLPMGPIGYARNGVPMFNPYNGIGENAVEGSTAESFDLCQGHPGPAREYHYHNNPRCLHGEGEDELVGIALDGFPIYGWMDAFGREFTSADLDDCHGHVDDDGRYRYRVTRDFPYFMGCYKGVVRAEVQARQQRRCYFAAGNPNPGLMGSDPPGGRMGPPTADGSFTSRCKSVENSASHLTALHGGVTSLGLVLFNVLHPMFNIEI